MFFRTPFNYDTDVASLESGLECQDASLTIQSHAEDADINVIVKRFGVSGTVPQSLVLPTYADYDGVMDYHSAMNAIRSADESFMRLPADLRTRFSNDAGLFVDFCSKPENLDELRQLGLAKPSSESVTPNGGSTSAGVSSTPSGA